MKKYSEMNKNELMEEFELVKAEYEQIKSRGLKLNLERGKPGGEQLNLVSPINDILTRDSDYICDGIDVRNYGNVDGLPCAKRLFADILGTKEENVFVGGNASLQLMYSIISIGFSNGLKNSLKPWCKEQKVKWLCPVPGYDRHFKVTESFGFELIPVRLNSDGPDMDTVEKLIKDDSVKGMWCVPKYSNPDGIIYSSDVIDRIASMKPAASDFALMWDNAYCVHEFNGEYVEFPDIISLCEQYGNPDMVYEFASTSKITFPGAGISCFATSAENIKYLNKIFNVQIISYDKINQYRHVLYLKDKKNTLDLMKKHAAVLKPKFDAVFDLLENEIKPRGIGRWTEPDGGYFISYFAYPGTAKRTNTLCKEAGLSMTAAGATYPYGIDPEDSNLRIAPSMPSLDDVKNAMELFCICQRYSAIEKILEKK